MISSILLAAGQSKRMQGENKLIKKIKGIPLIQHAIKNILDSPIEELIIVLGHQKEIIEKLIDKNKKIKIVFNKDFKSGMASSIKSGIKNLSKEVDAFFICLGDMPMINANIYDQLINAKSDKEIIVPVYKGQRGNPVLFSISMKKKLMSITGDTGAKQILKLNEDKIINLEVDDKNITRDFDTNKNFTT